MPPYLSHTLLSTPPCSAAFTASPTYGVYIRFNINISLVSWDKHETTSLLIAMVPMISAHSATRGRCLCWCPSRHATNACSSIPNVLLFTTYTVCAHTYDGRHIYGMSINTCRQTFKSRRYILNHEENNLLYSACLCAAHAAHGNCW